MFIKMNGAQHYLWRAVDQHGTVIDILVQPRRDRWAALRFFRKLLHAAERPPHVIITDKLRSYAAAKKLILPDVTHRQSPYLNNRAENSDQPTRVRERKMKRFQSPEQAQCFLSVFESINAPFRLRRHLLSATRYRLLRKQAFHIWNKSALVAHFYNSPYEQLSVLCAKLQHRPVKLTMTLQSLKFAILLDFFL